MAYDADLANRVREQLAGEKAVTEKRMFGGLSFLLSGNLTVAVSSRGGLMLRVGSDEQDKALSRPHTAPVEMRGSVMTGWIRVAPDGVKTTRQLESWVRRAVEFSRTLPPKG